MVTDRIVGVLARHRGWTIIVALAVFALFGFFAAQLGVDNSLEAWFVEDDPALLSYRDFLEEFGNDEVVVSAITGAESQITTERINRLVALEAALAAISGVSRVWSLASLVPQAASDQSIEVLQTMLPNSRTAKRLLGKDAHTLVVYAWLEKTPTLEQQRGRILSAIEAAFSNHLSDSERVYHGGFGVVYEALNQATLGEGALFIGLSYLIVLVAVFLVTGSWRWTGLALATVTMADTVVFGAMAMMGRSLNTVTVALPALVMVLGVAHVLHLATHIERGRRGQLLAAFALVAVPCSLNALTTAGGFLSLTSASMAITRDYGLFAAIGVLAAFGFALAGVAVVLPNVKQKPATAIKKALATGVANVIGWSLSHRRVALSISLVLLALAVFGAAQIDVDTDTLAFLPETSTARAHNQMLESLIGPYVPLELLITVPESGAWQSEAFVAQLTVVGRALEAQPDIGTVTSIADVVADLQLAWPQQDPSAIVAQAIEGASGRFWVSADQRTLRLTATVPLATAKRLAAIAQQAEALVREQLGTGSKVQASGYLPLYSRIVERLLDDQLTSFGVAFVVVFALVALVLRDRRFTMLSVPANLLPVALVLGVMGFLNIRLDLATVTIAAAVLGIVVDDTLHLLHGLKRHLQQGASLNEAFAQVAQTSGVAIVSTTVVFALGFGVIGLASVKSVAYVGVLTALAVVGALLVDLLLLPAMASLAWNRQMGRGIRSNL